VVRRAVSKGLVVAIVPLCVLVVDEFDIAVESVTGIKIVFVELLESVDEADVAVIVIVLLF
jgi:hypothetical protein